MLKCSISNFCKYHSVYTSKSLILKLPMVPKVKQCVYVACCHLCLRQGGHQHILVFQMLWDLFIYISGLAPLLYIQSFMHGVHKTRGKSSLTEGLLRMRKTWTVFALIHHLMEREHSSGKEKLWIGGMVRWKQKGYNFISRLNPVIVLSIKHRCSDTFSNSA